MCGRFFVGEPDDQWDETLRLLNRRAAVPGLKTSGEVYPTDVVPVLAPDRRGARAAFAMQWGFTLGQSGRRVINACSETAAEKPMFADGMARRRCAVPVSRYFEWTRGEAVRRKYAISPESGESFCLAGLYRIEAGKPVFTVLTRAASESVAFLHDRMPVLLTAGRAKDWIRPDADAAGILADALLPMACVRVMETAAEARPMMEYTES